MRPSRLIGAPAIGAALIALTAFAGPEKVEYPKDYRTRFVVYGIVDRPDRKIVRLFYANPEAVETAKPGQPVPDGAVLVMEDHKAQLDAKGQPVRDAEGRFVPTDEVTAVFVQEKRRGWGVEYPPEKRNGAWEYAWFNPDGSRKADAKFDGCFSCHQSRAARDYTFLFVKYIEDTKP
ncbi:MAG: cytochrome P460 family protein [Candidatus Rokuibacteriota bacterium]